MAERTAEDVRVNPIAGEESPALPTQNIEEHIPLAPPCLAGQHETCPHKVSYLGDDGVGRTVVCDCRCHDRAPAVAGESVQEYLYLISWEYEEKQVDAETKEPVSAWLRRRVLTNSKDIAGDWLDGVAQLIATNAVRRLVVRKTKIGPWETVD